MKDEDGGSPREATKLREREVLRVEEGSCRMMSATIEELRISLVH